MSLSGGLQGFTCSFTAFDQRQLTLLEQVAKRDDWEGKRCENALNCWAPDFPEALKACALISDSDKRDACAAKIIETLQTRYSPFLPEYKPTMVQAYNLMSSDYRLRMESAHIYWWRLKEITEEIKTIFAEWRSCFKNPEKIEKEIESIEKNYYTQRPVALRNILKMFYSKRYKWKALCFQEIIINCYKKNFAEEEDDDKIVKIKLEEPPIITHERVSYLLNKAYEKAIENGFLCPHKYLPEEAIERLIKGRIKSLDSQKLSGDFRGYVDDTNELIKLMRDWDPEEKRKCEAMEKRLRKVTGMFGNVHKDRARLWQYA